MKYSFEILEKAIGKERPRYNTKTHTTYTPQRTKDFEEKVRWSFVSKYNVSTEPSTKPFKAKIIAIFKPNTYTYLKMEINTQTQFLNGNKRINQYQKEVI